MFITVIKSYFPKIKYEPLRGAQQSLTYTQL